MYSSRVIAYWRGDSTLFRHYIAVGPAPPGGTAERSDTMNLAARDIGLCGDVARAAAIPTVVPRNPTGEETLSTTVPSVVSSRIAWIESTPIRSVLFW
jgi:hypothetical protein